MVPDRAFLHDLTDLSDQMKDAIARGQQGKKVPGFEQGDTVQKA